MRGLPPRPAVRPTMASHVTACKDAQCMHCRLHALYATYRVVIWRAWHGDSPGCVCPTDLRLGSRTRAGGHEYVLTLATLACGAARSSSLASPLEPTCSVHAPCSRCLLHFAWRTPRRVCARTPPPYRPLVAGPLRESISETEVTFSVPRPLGLGENLF